MKDGYGNITIAEDLETIIQDLADKEAKKQGHVVSKSSMATRLLVSGLTQRGIKYLPKQKGITKHGKKKTPLEK